jgi:hypothetical protein
METVIRNCETILEDIGETNSQGVIGELDDRLNEIFSEQGGTNVVYPAPKFWLEDTGCGSHSIHIRPPFFRECIVKAHRETKEAMEYAGFDSTIYDEIQDNMESIRENERAYWEANPDWLPEGKTANDMADEAAQNYGDNQLQAKGSKGQEVYHAEAGRVNEEVTERRTNARA